MKNRFAIFSILFLTLFILQCGKRPQIVARVGNQAIKIEDLRQQLRTDYPGTPIEKISLENRRKSLDKLIDDRLKTAVALKLGMDQDPEFKIDKENRFNQLIAQQLYQRVVVDSLVTEQLIKDYYHWKSIRVRGVAVFIGYKRLPGMHETRSREEADTLARQVAEKLKAAANPEEIALKYSNDRTVQKDKGIRDPFLVGRYSLNVDKAVFNAKEGDVVGPFSTRHGFLVMKILKRIDYKPTGDFEAERAAIKQQVFQTYFRRSARRLYHKNTNKFLKKFRGRISPKNVHETAEMFRKMLRLNNSNGKIDETQRSLLLVQIGNQLITVGDLVDKYGSELSHNLSRLADENYLKQTLTSRMEYLGWVLEAQKRGYGKLPRVKEAMEQYLSSHLAAYFEKKLVSGKVKVSQTDIHSYYEQHKSEFSEPEKIHIWQIAVMKKSKIDKIARLLKNGADFQELARKYNVNTLMQRKGGDMGFQSVNSIYGTLVKKALEAGPHKLIGPLTFGPGYYMLKTGEYKPAHFRDLNKVIGLVKSKVRQEKEAEVRKKLLDKYRKDFSFRVNESLLRRIS